MTDAIDESLFNIAVDLGSLQNLLVSKGVFTEKEWQDTKAQVTTLFDQLKAKAVDELSKELADDFIGRMVDPKYGSGA